PGGTLTYTATYTIVQGDVDQGKLLNQATVTAVDPDGDDVSDDSGTTAGTDDETEVTLEPASPSLSFVKEGVFVDKNGNTRADAGDEIEYTFTVVNDGNVTMSSITLAELSFSGTGTAPVPVFSAALSDVATSGSALAPGQKMAFQATYVLTQGDIVSGGVENLAGGAGTPPTTDPGMPASPIAAVVSTPDAAAPGTPGVPGVPAEVVLVSDASITLVKTAVIGGSGTGNVGEEVTYTFVVTNTG